MQKNLQKKIKKNGCGNYYSRGAKKEIYWLPGEFSDKINQFLTKSHQDHY